MRAASIHDARFRVAQTKPLLDQIARSAVFKMLENLARGHLVLEEDGRSHSFGEDRANASVVAHISVKEPWAYRQVLFNGTVGSGEAYMLGGWDSPNIVNVIRVFVLNRPALQALEKRWTKLGGVMTDLFHKLKPNTIKGSKANIAAHYDLSNDFFRLFLDPTMMYSSAVYPSEDSTLDEAAVYKVDHICQRLQLKETDHLIEIGTGWGGVALHAARHYGCKVTTTTISQRQYEYAKQAVEEAGLSDRINVLCKDYRLLEGQYDKLVSVEMIEAVGHRFLQPYFEQCSHLLKPDGLMLLQAITIKDQRYEAAKRSVDFIQRYIFPGGALPSIQAITNQVADNTDMRIVGLEDISEHYARTLADWRARFFDQQDRVRELGFDDIFIRMWDFYLSYSEGGFRERLISTVQVMMAKPDCRIQPIV